LNSQIILNFHGIGTPHAGVDDGERPYWISEARFAEVLDQVDNHPARDRVYYTFDDGNRSDMEIALPALLARGRTASFFILAGRFDDPNYVTREDCRSLVQHGMAVGLHGRNHVDWRALSEADFADETVAAREEVAAASGQPVTAVGVPFGNYNRRVIARLKRQGFDPIYTSDSGSAGAGARIRNRTSLRSDMPPSRIAALLDGSEPLKPRLRRALSTFLRRNVV
jgi:peptidoglycan/xylan/chitin deacetylase (PgdA/CDA1 family)